MQLQRATAAGSFLAAYAAVSCNQGRGSNLCIFLAAYAAVSKDAVTAIDFFVFLAAYAAVSEASGC